jgi:glycine hydroxymethyltransferase
MQDNDIHAIIKGERSRQETTLELIPSENYVSRDVLTALASEFTNKYAEGYPGKRYYGGQEFTDRLESLAIERAKRLFRADHANLQPHSGAQANAAVYYAWANLGDTILAMDLSHGGHLTHGHPVTILAKQYNFVRYGMKDVVTGEIDYDELRRIALKTMPKIIIAGHSSYPRKLDYDAFVAIGKEVNALLMADMAHLAGLIAGGVERNPLDAGFHVMTCTTHKTLRGPRGGMILSKGVVGNPLQSPPQTIEHIPTIIDRMVFPGMQGGPHMNVIAAKAVALYEASQDSFARYAKQVVRNAQVLADELCRKGVILVTGGTDNHLLLIDTLRSFGVDGKEAEARLEAIGLNANKNVIPNDAQPPFRPSGLRIGTPAATTRGMKEPEMRALATIIVKSLRSEKALSDHELLSAVKSLTSNFPLPN